MAELKIKIIGHETEIVGLEGGIDSKMAELKVEIANLGKIVLGCTGVILTLISIATGIIVIFN